MAENFVSKGSGAIEVPFSDDETVRDDELLLDDEKPGETPEQKQARKDRRRQRSQERDQERKDAISKADRVERELNETREKLARLEGVVASSRQPATGKDQFQARLEAVEEKRRNAYEAANAEMATGKMTKERMEHYSRVGQEVEEEKIRIHTEKVLAERLPAQRQEQAQQVWRQKYPEVYGNDQAYQYAQATFTRRRLTGEKDSNDLVDEVMNEARTVFKLGGKSTPTKTDRERLSGTPSSGSGGGDNRVSGGISMTKELRAMAEAKYSDLPQEKAWKQWADNEGKELRKQKVL